eukprot:1147849-Pelagomonas_calceolata.AAC.4
MQKEQFAVWYRNDQHQAPHTEGDAAMESRVKEQMGEATRVSGSAGVLECVCCLTLRFASHNSTIVIGLLYEAALNDLTDQP